MEKYIVIGSTGKNDSGILCKTYGIALRVGATLQQRIEDISTDRKSVKTLAARLNRSRLPAVHFASVVEDMLFSGAC